ncbi:MAG: hypothetical protein GY842_17615 [bacterium]|nr:hypothetical protein [bacterium]
MSTVIKAGQDFKLVKRLTTIDLADHLTEADRIIAEARDRARAILLQARRDAAAALVEAKRRGHAEGQAEGHREGFTAGQKQGLEEATDRFSREQATLGETFSAAATGLDGLKRDLLIEARHDSLEFAVSLARRVTKRIGELNRDAATANLEEALSLVSSKTDVTVRVNPIDAETLRRFAAGLADRASEWEHVRVIEDETVAPGGCRILSGTTEVDADLESQLSEIVRLLLGE